MAHDDNEVIISINNNDGTHSFWVGVWMTHLLSECLAFSYTDICVSVAGDFAHGPDGRAEEAGQQQHAPVQVYPRPHRALFPGPHMNAILHSVKELRWYHLKHFTA
eukprot:scaffold171361_cov37-Prasinocladus_malaysianus.AAC.2